MLIKEGIQSLYVSTYPAQAFNQKYSCSHMNQGWHNPHPKWISVELKMVLCLSQKRDRDDGQQNESDL